MANPTIQNNDTLQVPVFNPLYKDATINFVGALTYLVGTIMARIGIAAGAVTAGVGNTGDGTVTGLALAGGGLAEAGSYNLECTIAGTAGRAVGAVTPDAGNTGDGTVTGYAVAAGETPEIGTFVLTCTDANAGGTASAGVVTPGGGDTGDGAPGLAVPAANVKEGTYTLSCVEAAANAGRFTVTDPDGEALEDLTVAVAYSNTHFALTIADGAADFIVGDSFTIVMTIAHGGLFTLTDPDGVALLEDIVLPGTPAGTVDVTSGGIQFTITDGATDFAVDDFFSMVIVAADGGTFKLEDPFGNLLDNSIVMGGVAGGATTYVGFGLTFILTDGATDFVVGDTFALAITDVGEKWTPYVEGAVDGSGIPSGVLPAAVTSTGAVDLLRRMIVGGEMAKDAMVIHGGAVGTVPDDVAQSLRNYGIVVREGRRIDSLDNQ